MPRKTDPFRPYRRLSVTKLAKLLSEASGQQVTAEVIRADLAAGAPVNRDGTISLVRYAAWLVAQGAQGKKS